MDQDINTQNKEQTKEDRKRAKEAEIEKRVHARKVRKIAIWTGVIVFLTLVGTGSWYLISVYKKTTALGPDFSQEFKYQDAQKEFIRQHITEGTKSSIPYLSNPPTSGPHWPEPVRDAVYDRSQPDEGLVHSLEHGRIWISYKSSIPEEAKKKLRTIALNEAKVILTVRDSNPTDIAVAAWERLDTFNLNADGSFDEKRIRDFIQRYRNRGPEDVPFMTGKAYD